MMRQYELVEAVRDYDPNADETLLNRAYVFAMRAHGQQKRASGDPYIVHPLEVAGILTRYRLDTASIATALLHDTLEDTTATYDELQSQFGDEVARLVDGVTKLSQLEWQSDRAKQAENFRKLVLAMSQDIRVLLVKLADRLHNMRTLGHLAPDRRRRVARETMEIYAPLAERVGLVHVKDELEDLAFAILNPDARDSVVKRLVFLEERAGEGLVERIETALTDVLAAEGMPVAVTGRRKTPFSVWRKMERQQVGFEMLSDIMAFRIVVNDVASCYQALGVVHAAYPVVPGLFKDYISVPKQNGYRSLHTVVMGPENQRIEIQIRTREMHEVAERGVAAHWHYKLDAVLPTEVKHYAWLQKLLDISESAAGAEEFLEHTKLEMFQDQVFCFSPKGEVFPLPRGATPIDFAYAVHSEIGDHCVGARVNGRLVPLRTVLNNGDQVRVLTSQAQTPSPEWEQMVVSGKARSRIRRFVHREQQAQYARLGREILEKMLAQEGKALDEEKLDGVLAAFECQDRENIYAKLGEGQITARAVIAALAPRGSSLTSGALGMLRRRRRPSAGDGSHAVPIRGLTPGVAVHLAKCCYPLPGDRIVGIMTMGKGVTVHTIDCDTLASFADQPENWVDLTWDVGDGEAKQVSRLNATLTNSPGSLGELATLIARHEGNISNLKFTNRTEDFFDMTIDVEVTDAKHLSTIVAALRASPAIVSVKRVRT